MRSHEPLPDFGLPKDILAQATRRGFERHESIALQGQTAAEVHGVLVGTIKIWRTEPDGLANTLLLLGPGEQLGLISTLLDKPNVVSAVALEPVETLAWPKSVFLRALGLREALAASVMRAIATRAVQLIDHLGDISPLTVERRIARVTLRLAERFGRIDPARGTVLSLRQQELAEMAQATIPTVSRVLSARREAGIIETRRREIVVRSLTALARISNVQLD